MLDGGIFDDPEEVEFESDTQAPSDYVSPGDPTVVTNLPTQVNKTHLICVADQQGQPMVARCVADKTGQLQPIEEYRRPTQEEWNKLQSKGQVVKQGQSNQQSIGEVSAQSGGFGFTIGKVVLATATLAAGGLGIWYLVKKSKSPDNVNNEIDNEDDIDDDDNDEDDEN